MANGAYEIVDGFLSVKSGDVTLTGNVRDVVITADEPDYGDMGQFDLNVIRVHPTTYRLTADFVPDDKGTSVTIAKKKTIVTHEVSVVADGSDIDAIAKAVSLTGAPAEHTVSTRLITVDGAVKSKVTVSWEENK